MTFKKIIGKIHLWLGFTSGLLVFIVAITGCLLAFEDEIKSITRSFQQIETPLREKLLPPSALAAKAKTALIKTKEAEPNGILYNENNKTASVWFWGVEPEYFYTVHINPYTGETVEITDEEKDFFHIVIHGHYYLWLPPSIGQPVVSYATLIFAIMLISGLILWWPKNKKARKQRITIKWSGKWRRVNYDLHGVMGFYVMAIGLVLALSGMIMGIEWFANAVYTATGGEGTAQYTMPPSDTTAVTAMSAPQPAIDEIWAKLLPEKADKAAMYISFPQTETESFYAYINHQPHAFHQVDYYHFDQYTLEKLSAEGPFNGKYEESVLADKLQRMNYDIHRGAILGLPGKVLAFLASLIIASLPVTGFIIWWGRSKKSKKYSLKVNKPARTYSKKMYQKL